MSAGAAISKIIIGIISVIALTLGWIVMYHVVKNAAPDYLGYWFVGVVLTSIIMILSWIGSLVDD